MGQNGASWFADRCAPRLGANDGDRLDALRTHAATSTASTMHTNEPVHTWD